MRVFILVDEDNIVRCIASEECNLHKDKSHMRKYHVERGGTVGDEFHNPDEWIARPENYPQPTEEEVREQRIALKSQEIIRKMAIKELEKEDEAK